MMMIWTITDKQEKNLNLKMTQDLSARESLRLINVNEK